jgi:hypothetical protein
LIHIYNSTKVLVTFSLTNYCSWLRAVNQLVIKKNADLAKAFGTITFISMYFQAILKILSWYEYFYFGFILPKSIIFKRTYTSVKWLVGLRGRKRKVKCRLQKMLPNASNNNTFKTEWFVLWLARFILQKRFFRFFLKLAITCRSCLEFSFL